MLNKDDLQATYNNTIKLLERQRDEINLKIHLANMEVKEDWAELEKKLEHLRAKGMLIKKEAVDSAHELEDTISMLGDEIREGYKRIKKLM